MHLFCVGGSIKISRNNKHKTNDLRYVSFTAEKELLFTLI
jgi:hypothetical protein